MTELRVPSDDANLAVTYQAAGDAAVVALHGASEGTRDFKLYEHLHRVLPPIGIGVATFDRRGEGDSTGEPSLGRFDVQLTDCLAVSRALGAPDIGLWGFSQGAWIAPLASARVPNARCLVTIASTGVTPAQQMQYGVARHLVDAGYGHDVVETVRALRADVGLAMHGTLVDEDSLVRRLRDASEEPWWPLAHLRDVLPDARGRAAWVQEMDFDPTRSFAAVRCPTLCFYGADDEWQPVDASVAAWRRARGENVDISIIDGVGHDLTNAAGRIDPRYQRHLVAWLATHLQPT